MREKADLILLGNHIFQGAAFDISKGFVAIKDNIIIGVEDRRDIMEAYMKESTKVIDCGDGFIMPGFHDCHVHILQGGIFENGVQLQDCTSEEEAAIRIKEYADGHPELPWILGCGWYHIYWDNKELPTKSSLDRYVSDRPVFLENEDGHGAWVNSKALELCGITKDSKDPAFGKIFRDAEGNPTGYLDELAMALCGEKAYDLPETQERKYFDDFIAEAIKYGVTSVNDMRPLFTFDLGKLKTYEALNENNQQPIRIHFATNLFDDIKKAKELKKKYVGGKLHYCGLKQFIDGVAISYTSLLKEDYADKGGCKGYALVTGEMLDEAVINAQREGIEVHLHVTGDEAVALSLDAFKKARKQEGNLNLRHSLEHIDLIDPQDLHRLNEMNITASMQPEHMAPTLTYEDNPYPVRFGEERAKYAWAIRSILSSGANVAFGTDFPVAGLNPLMGIYRSVTRRADDGNPKEGWNPQERISVTDALSAYTLGSAKMVGREDQIGTLEIGKLADIAVLDKNPIEAEAEELKEVEIKLTVCDGKVVYSKK